MSLVRCGGVTWGDNIAQARVWCWQPQHERGCWLGGGAVLGSPLREVKRNGTFLGWSTRFQVCSCERFYQYSYSGQAGLILLMHLHT